MPKIKLAFVPLEENGLLADVGIKISVQCLDCINLRKGVTCNAFPEGIPEKIVSGKHDHRKPFLGDHGIQYESIRKAKA